MYNEVTFTEKKTSFLAWLMMLATIGVTGIILLLLVRMIKKRRKRGMSERFSVDVDAADGTTVDVSVNGNQGESPNILDVI